MPLPLPVYCPRCFAKRELTEEAFRQGPHCPECGVPFELYPRRGPWSCTVCGVLNLPSTARCECGYDSDDPMASARAQSLRTFQRVRTGLPLFAGGLLVSGLVELLVAAERPWYFMLGPILRWPFHVLAATLFLPGLVQLVQAARRR